MNEVTIFRTFGSKAALIDEVLQRSSRTTPDSPGRLPAVPTDPQKELTAWSESQLAELTLRKPVMRQMLGDMAEKPEMGDCASRGADAASDELRRYTGQLRRLGFLEPATSSVRDRSVEIHAARAMLMAALFSDAISRDFMPDLYPQPASRAPGLYARLFLRAIRLRQPAPPPTDLTPTASNARRSGVGPKPRTTRR